MNAKMVLYAILRSLLIQIAALITKTLDSPDIDTNGETAELTAALSHIEAAQKQVRSFTRTKRKSKPVSSAKS